MINISKYNIEPLKSNYNAKGMVITELTDYLQYFGRYGYSDSMSINQTFHFSSYLNIKFKNILGAKNGVDTTYQQYIDIGNIIQIRYIRNSEYKILINGQLILNNLQSLLYDKLISWDFLIKDKYYRIIINDEVWAEGNLTDSIPEQDFQITILVGASYGNLKIGNVYIDNSGLKYLIRQNEQYYSVKDNALVELGTPADDTEKKRWFDDYGVEDLKEALLTINNTTEIKSNSETLNEGNLFRFNIPSNFKSINKIN